MNNTYDKLQHKRKWGNLTPQNVFDGKKKTEEQLQTVMALLSMWKEAERNKETYDGYERKEKRTHS